MTPAPWSISHGPVSGGEGYFVTADDGHVALVFSLEDARAIAALPEVVEALREARQTILDLKNSRWSEAEGSDEEWVAGLDAALLKAGAA